MKYKTLPSTFFEKNRARFTAQMKPNTVAIFHSNDLYKNNADGNYRFVQDSNMYYLSGIDQEEVILFLFPDAPDEKWREMLFVKKTNEHIQIWDGWKYSKEEAREASGIKSVHFYDDFTAMFRRMAAYFDGIYIDTNEFERNVRMTYSSAHRVADEVKRAYPVHQYYRSAPILHDLRVIKSEEELGQLKEACAITAKAFDRVLKFLKPGVMEYEVEAEIAYAFLKNGGTCPAFDTIAASGKNACVLHYIMNDAQCKDGDMMLLDFGAEYGHYSADMTRSIPVNGKFTKRQKEIYTAVLRTLKFATSKLVPGTLLHPYQDEVGLFVQEELLKIGVLTQKEVDDAPENAPAYKKYMMHGISHHLGLDTHDVGNNYAPFRPGMVYTCEPGIYIPEEGIGIRLENDILITENGPVNLLADVPLEIEEIEEAMAKSFA